MALNTNGTNGADSAIRYSMTSTTPHQSSERRRPRKNMNGNYNYNNGPRDNRMNNYRGDGRISHRSSGGSGDGPHNGSSSYRGGSGADYEAQAGMTVPNSEGHVRTTHNNSHQTQGHHYHHYNQQQQHHSHHHQKSEYENPRQHRSGGHQSDHQHHYRSNTGAQQTDNMHQHPHSNYGGGGGTHHHQVPNPGEIVIVSSTQQQEHSYTNGSGGHAHIANHFQSQQIPGPAPPPTMSFVGVHPNSQPMFGSLALCHIPYGVNPSSVISPCVYTQIIGSGLLTPGLPYNYPCAFPSPVMPSHPVIIQQAAHQQQHQMQPHFHPGSQQPQYPAAGGMQQQPHPTGGDDGLVFDSSSLLNPDADAFFPPTFPPDQDQTGEDDDPGSGICSDRPLETSEIKSDEQVTPRHDSHDAGDGDLDEDEEVDLKKEEDDEVDD